MKLKRPKNSNYCATVVSINKIVPLENCDNVKGAYIFGEQVIISNTTQMGDVGVYFPPETQLSNEFTHHNNLYRDPSLNNDPEQKGYFETNRRVRTVKFRGNKSVGFWMPVTCLAFTKINVEQLKQGDEFEELNGFPICNKYIKKRNPAKLPNNARSRKQLKKKTSIVENQFRFHKETQQLAKNMFRLGKQSLISLTYKLHGTSFVASKVLCKKKLGLFSRILKRIGIPVTDTEYKNVYSSRKVIKNLYEQDTNSFYGVDIWGLANKKVEDLLHNGMTAYGEIVGFLPTGGYIQKPYDYGLENNYEIYVYRITYTNVDGKVFELSAKQVQDWCKLTGIKAVPELYYGTLSQFCKDNFIHTDSCDEHLIQLFVEKLKKMYLEKDCTMCANKVPGEGIVLRVEGPDYEAYKLKSIRFLEHETKMLDKDEIDIETDEADESDAA